MEISNKNISKYSDKYMTPIHVVPTPSGSSGNYSKHSSNSDKCCYYLYCDNRITRLQLFSREEHSWTI